MNAYLDTSVILRVILDQPGRLAEWSRIAAGVTSAIAEVECLRTLDRIRLGSDASVEAQATAREALHRTSEGLRFVAVTPPVLRRAGQSMPTPLRTLDAIHLVTAEMWRESSGQDLVFATHDGALALAARASGFRVLGV